VDRNPFTAGFFFARNDERDAFAPRFFFVEAIGP
jgi:hypothetical protein